MGFEGKTILKLTFDDPALAGLEVSARRPTMDQMIDLDEKRDAMDSDRGRVRAVAELFCELLIDWNLTNEGEPVAHIADELLAQDYSVSQSIIRAWENNSFEVAGPLEPSSSGGATSVVASIPMETLSESRAS